MHSITSDSEGRNVLEPAESSRAWLAAGLVLFRSVRIICAVITLIRTQSRGTSSTASKITFPPSGSYILQLQRQSYTNAYNFYRSDRESFVVLHSGSPSAVWFLLLISKSKTIIFCWVFSFNHNHRRARISGRNVGKNAEYQACPRVLVSVYEMNFDSLSFSLSRIVPLST